MPCESFRFFYYYSKSSELPYTRKFHDFVASVHVSLSFPYPFRAILFDQSCVSGSEKEARDGGMNSMNLQL